MGNIGSTDVNSPRRIPSRRSQQLAAQSQPPQPEISSNQYVFAAATPPYPTQYPNPNTGPYYHYPGYSPIPPPAPHDHNYGRRRMGSSHENWYGQYPCEPVMRAPVPYLEHQNAETIRIEVNIKKETLRIEPDEANPGKFLVAFTFDATVSGRLTIVFFAKEGEHCCLSPMKETLLPPVMLTFQHGLAQEFRQPSGTGIDLSMFSAEELSKEGEMDVYPLALKAEVSPENSNGSTEENPSMGARSTKCQIAQAVFEKDKGKYHVRVMKQILWVKGRRYVLQEIYGLGNAVDSDFDGNDLGKECVVCLSDPRDTALLPCRHMCLCSGCAKVLRFQTNKCPICRQPVDRLLEIKVNKGSEE